MTDTMEAPVVELTIPSKPEYVGVARLTILGVASRMQFTYDEVEDIRLAVGEACTTAVERAKRANVSDGEITITSEIAADKLIVKVQDNVQCTDADSEESASDLDEQGLGALLMELLVDEFKVESTPEGTLVSMVKYPG